MAPDGKADKRAVFDFEIDFLNGGGIQWQGFRLDILNKRNFFGCLVLALYQGTT